MRSDADMPDRRKLDLDGEERELGLGCPITRRDFIGTTLLGAGAGLLGLPAPLGGLSGDPAAADRARTGASDQAGDPWTGYPGVGDYARSNGDPWEVVTAGHRIRDGVFEHPPAHASDTGETYDLVVVGGGMSGLVAAHRFRREAAAGMRCLVLENHSLAGGESKRNVLQVDGELLIAPQGANQFGYPRREGPELTICRDAGVPALEARRYQAWAPGVLPLEIARENWEYMLWSDLTPAMGFFFQTDSGGSWVRNMWSDDLARAPYAEGVRRDLLRWRKETREPREFPDQGQLERWLDTMTYQEYLEGVLGLGPAVARYAHPILASYLGLGCDALSAYIAYETDMPGFQMYTGPYQARHMRDVTIDAFPGGNDAVARCILKYLVPEAITGGKDFADVHNGRIRFDELDRAGRPIRVRLGATAVRVEHEGPPDSATHARVTYTHGGEVYTLRARTVVMASNGWTARHVVRGLPPAYRAAYAAFPRSPVLVANVALHDWKPMYRAGYTAFEWFEGFGFAANFSRSMVIGDYRPPLDPARPRVLTLYVPLFKPGLPVAEQGIQARYEMFGTSYRGYEKVIRGQLARLFGGWGFDPARDIAALVLNRWGHAYVNPAPGFFFGRDGADAPRDVIRRSFGRIAFAGAELGGHQHAGGAIGEGWRAAGQCLEMI
jgi:spermidine dehydrogenase